MSIIEENKDKIKALCGQHNVDSLFVFGSVLKKNFSASSDIDFLVDFKDVSLYDYADNYYNLKYELEALLKREIDLLENQAVRNPYLRESIESSKQLLYG